MWISIAKLLYVNSSEIAPEQRRVHKNNMIRFQKAIYSACVQSYYEKKNDRF